MKQSSAVWLSWLLVAGMGVWPIVGVALQQGASKNSQPPASPNPAPTTPIRTTFPLHYVNNRYSFCFLLPEDWKGYSIVPGQWHGYRNVGPNGEADIAQGPIITIRHPNWTSKEPYQDIPIMVFTPAQWYSVTHPDAPGAFLISAAPIGPEELGRNRRYIFALPPRYNYAFPKGWQQVNQIIQSRPLHAPCRSN
jgi:hypothetical protein